LLSAYNLYVVPVSVEERCRYCAYIATGQYGNLMQKKIKNFIEKIKSIMNAIQKNLNNLNALLLEGKGLDAFEMFYDDDVVMQ